MIGYMSANDDRGMVLLAAFLLPFYAFYPIFILMHVSRRVTSGIELSDYHEDNDGYESIVGAMQVCCVGGGQGGARGGGRVTLGKKIYWGWPAGPPVVQHRSKRHRL